MRYRFLLTLACVLLACVDQEPMSSALSDDDALYASDGRGVGPRVRREWAVSAFAPYNGIDVVGDQPWPGAVFDAQDDGTIVGAGLFPEPVAFIACFCFGIVDYPFYGVATRYNLVALGGAEIQPWRPTPIGPLGSGNPVLFDLVTWRILDLPLPGGARSAIVTGMGRFRRPFVVGTANYLGGNTRAVGWTFNTTTRAYEVMLLPTGGATLSGASNANIAADLIVGHIDGHPATWPLSNPTTFTTVPTIDGEFRDVNSSLVFIGRQATGEGFMHSGGTTTIIAMEPTSINDPGYVVGIGPSGAVLRLLTGVIRDLPKPEARYDFSAASVVTNLGWIGGTAGVFPNGKPVMWEYGWGYDPDHDLVPNDMDNCPGIANGQQEDADNNFVGDICEPGSPPVPIIVANATQRFEGTAFLLDAGTSTDPLGRPLTYRWDFGDGTSAVGQQVRKIYIDEGTGTYTVTLTADNQVETADATLDVTVRNSRPNLNVGVSGFTWPAGTLFEAQLDMDDAGVNDTFTYIVEWGDGAVDSGPCATNPCTVNVSHTYSAPGSMAFRARVSDGVISRHYAATLDIQ